MKSTIQAIYNAAGKEFPTNTATLKAIDFLSELIEENHKLDEPEEFTFEDEPCIEDFAYVSEFIISKQEWESEYNALEQEYQEENEANYSVFFDAIESLESDLGNDDFYFEYDGNEYRIIAESAIWEIYVDEIKNIVTDCYELKIDNIPNFVAFEIDWEQTAKNCYCYADGHGHTFSGYDGSELEICGFYVFRTN